MGLRLLADPPSWEGHLELRSWRPGLSGCAGPEDRQTALEIRRTRRSENSPQRKLGLVVYAHRRQGRGQGSDSLQHAHAIGRLRSEDRRVLVVLRGIGGTIG